MTDCFALLGLPRAAALDEAALQAAWHEKGRAAHPDSPGGDAALAADINAAHEILSQPEKRLKHLLELHAEPWRTVPISAELMDLFMKMGAELQNAAALAKKRQSASSALVRALLAPQEMRLQEALEALNAQIEAFRSQELEKLPLWDQAPTQDFAALQTIQATLAYLAKWRTQIREALLALV